jgi:tRNA threonylcarbamoyladenosine biosynthesis protein TsaE
MQITTSSLKETEAFARDFVEKLTQKAQKAVVVGLQGDLGSGKTTLVQGVAKALGVTKLITSPTFVIEKVYKLYEQKFDHLVHIDAYRLENGDELTHLGWKELVENPKNLIFVEWPERVRDVMPGNTVEILFTFVNENTRAIEIINA